MSIPPDSPKNTIPPSPPSAPPRPTSHLYGGYTRFELELEFVSLLSSPLYLNHLATLKLLSQPDFIAYLSYLRYWAQPPYIQYLAYPGPTLKMLELLQVERFRREVLGPGVVGALVEGLLSHPDFVAYLRYLRYCAQPPYIQYLAYPGRTLKMLELLQVERFRREVLGPGVVGALVGGLVGGS